MAQTNSTLWASFKTSELTVDYGITKDKKIRVTLYFDKLKKSGVEMELNKTEAKGFCKEILVRAGVSQTLLKQI